MADTPNRDAAEFDTGDRVGPFTIEGHLGEGGMGMVYRATDADGATVALKIVRGSLAGDIVFRKRFEREVKTAQRVSHPHVVPVLAVGEHEGLPYMAQQFISGGTVQDMIERHGTVELERTVTLALQIAKGLTALHAQGLTHRDLKPANVLLDESGSAFVADLGLAKDRDASVLTKAGQAVGSMDYMAPEQIRGEEVGPQADVYSLGCVIFECLAGEPPFADRQGMQILWAHLQDEPPDLGEKRPEVSKEVSWAVLRGLEKEASKRPPSPIAYARMVQVAAGTPPLSPRGD